MPERCYLPYSLFFLSASTNFSTNLFEKADFVCMEDGKIVGVFVFIIYIEDGSEKIAFD